jgi:hypothetical protein
MKDIKYIRRIHIQLEIVWNSVLRYSAGTYDKFNLHNNTHYYWLSDLFYNSIDSDFLQIYSNAISILNNLPDKTM